MRAIQIRQSQRSIAHLLPTLLIALIAISGSGYLVYQHSDKNVSLAGRITKVTSGPSTYKLTSSDNKTYIIVGKTNTPANPTTVTVKNIKSSSAPASSPAPTSSQSQTTATIVSTSSPTPPSSSPVVTYPSDVSFTSTITADSCDRTSGPPIGDTGCGITTANGYNISVRRGNIYSSTPSGSIDNAPSSGQTWVGKTVEVYAQATASGQATILANSKYYVTFTN